MTANISLKAVAWGGITVMTAGAIAIGTEVTRGMLFEIRNSHAATSAALAELEKAKAEMAKASAETLAANASKLDAQNKLLAAIEARNGTERAAFLLAAGQRGAAETSGQYQIKSTEIDRHVDNAVFDTLFSPLVAQPLGTINTLNRRSVRFKHEARTGIDTNSRRVLTESEMADRIAQARILDEEASIEGEISAKNIGDLLNVALKGATSTIGSAGGMSGLYPTGNEPAPTRVINEEPRAGAYLPRLEPLPPRK